MVRILVNEGALDCREMLKIQEKLTFLADMLSGRASVGGKSRGLKRRSCG
jgi:hypothetical protein